MKIGIDARELIRPYTGTGMYVLNLIRGLSSIDKNNQYLLFVDEDYIPSLALSDNFIFCPIKSFSSSKINDQWSVYLGICKYKPDVFHVTHHDVTPFITNMPLVITVLDIAWIDLQSRSFLFEKYYYHLTRLAMLKAARVLTISEYTAERVAHHFSFVSSKVAPIPIACDPFYEQGLIDEKIRKSLISEFHLHLPYILYVGSFAKRKNLSLLMKAMQIVLNDFPDVRLVVAGKPSGRDDTDLESFNVPFTLISRSKTEEELKLLYQNAEMLVFPSMYEGFGLPVLEAMTSRCPVIAGNTTSLPEIVGQAGILVDPFNEVELSERIQALLKDSILKENLREKGRARSKMFNWDKVAAETLENYYKAVAP